MKFIFFFAIPLAIIALNLFLIRAVWRAFAKKKFCRYLAAGTASAVLLIILSAFVAFLTHSTETGMLGFTWRAFGYLVAPMIYASIWAMLGSFIGKITPPLRRHLKIFVILGGIIITGTCAYGYWRFLNPCVTYLAWENSSKTLVKNSDFKKQDKSPKYRIVATADWHLGLLIDRERVKQFVEKINEQNPDVVVISGDLIDAHMAPVEAQRLDEILRTIHAPAGVFAALGNHEYHAQELLRIKSFLEKAKIKLLVDQVAQVGLKGGNTLCIAGRDDATNPQRRSSSFLVEQARKINNSSPILVLDHQPKDNAETSRAGADLVFNGHTHAGQLWPVTWLVSLFNPNVYGIWENAGTRGYVTSGIGLWHIPYRIGSVSEIVVIDAY